MGNQKSKEDKPMDNERLDVLGNNKLKPPLQSQEGCNRLLQSIILGTCSIKSLGFLLNNLNLPVDIPITLTNIGNQFTSKQSSLSKALKDIKGIADEETVVTINHVVRFMGRVTKMTCFNETNKRVVLDTVSNLGKDDSPDRNRQETQNDTAIVIQPGPCSRHPFQIEPKSDDRTKKAILSDPVENCEDDSSMILHIVIVKECERKVTLGKGRNSGVQLDNTDPKILEAMSSVTIETSSCGKTSTQESNSKIQIPNVSDSLSPPRQSEHHTDQAELAYRTCNEGFQSDLKLKKAFSPTSAGSSGHAVIVMDDSDVISTLEEGRSSGKLKCYSINFGHKLKPVFDLDVPLKSNQDPKRGTTLCMDDGIPINLSESSRNYHSAVVRDLVSRWHNIPTVTIATYPLLPHTPATKDGENPPPCQHNDMFSHRENDSSTHTTTRNRIQERALDSYFENLSHNAPPNEAEQMSLEWLRLGSFASYNGNGCAHRLAQNGFYYVDGTSTGTRCFCCNRFVTDWQFFDNIEERHRHQYPNCPVVLGTTNSNVPISLSGGSVFAEGSNFEPNVCESVPATEAAEKTENCVVSSAESERLWSGDLLVDAYPVMVNEARPMVYEARPMVNEARPMVNEARPVGNEARSLVNEARPMVDEARPMVDQARPMVNEARSLFNQARPMVNQARPMVNQARQMVNKARPMVNKARPMTNEARPMTNEARLMVNGARLMVNEARPMVNEARLNVNNARPRVNETRPLVDQKENMMGTAAHQMSNKKEAETIETFDSIVCQPVEDVKSQQSPARPTISSSFTLTPPSQVQRPSLRGGASSRNASTDTPPSSIRAEQARRRCQNIRNQDFAPLSTRISSFQGMPSFLEQTPQQLAEAGLFYTGVADMLRCFCCNGGLRNWEPEDDPILEHIRWFPTCEYILQLKGETFVQEVVRQQEVPRRESPSNEIQTQSYSASAGSRSDDREDETTSLLEMGYTVARVKDVLLKLRRLTGRMEITAEEVLNLILEEEDQGISQPPPGRPPNISLVQTQPSIASQGAEASVHQSSPNSKKRSQSKHSQGNNSLNQTAAASKSAVASGNSTQKRNKGANPGRKQEKAKLESCKPSGAETKGASSAVNDPESLLEENKKLKEMQLCKVCLDSPVAVTFLPCGHLVCCEKCAKLLRHCPICRKRIKGTVKTFMS